MTNRTLVLSSIYIHHLLKMEHQTKTELVSDFRSPVTVKHKQSNFSINGDEISGKVELLRRNYVWGLYGLMANGYVRTCEGSVTSENFKICPSGHYFF